MTESSFNTISAGTLKPCQAEPFAAQEGRKGLLETPLAELMIGFALLYAPFSLLFDHFVFNGFKVAGMGVSNIIVSALIVAATILTMVRESRLNMSFFAAFALLVFMALMKYIYQPTSSLLSWLAGHEYYFLVPLVALCLSSDAIDRRRFASWLLNVSVVICLISLFLFATNDYHGLVGNDILAAYDVVGMPFARMLSVFGSPNVAGTYFAIMLFLDLFCCQTKSRLRVLRYLLLGICLFLTFSRMAIGGFLAAVAIRYMLNGLKGRSRSTVALRVFVIALCAIGAVLVFLFLSGKGLYFFDLGGSDIVDNPRFVKWIAFLSGANPIMLLAGEPIGSTYVYEGVSLSDNSFLQSFASFGLIVAVAYWALLFQGVKKTRGKIDVAALVMIIIFLAFSDFVQLYPSCYFAFLILFGIDRSHSEIEEKVIEHGQ